MRRMVAVLVSPLVAFAGVVVAAGVPSRSARAVVGGWQVC